MDSKDIISKLGMPNKILIGIDGAVETMKSKTWKCYACGTLYVSEEPVRNPAPCKNCEGIFFEKIKVEVGG